MTEQGELTVTIGYPQTELNPLRVPLPTQRKFHASKAKYRLLAGGFGSGKTTTLVIECLCELFKYPGNYGVLGRKDLGELKSTTLKELLDVCPPQLITNHNKQDHIIKFINGSELYYMNLDDSRDAVEKIKSLNLGFVAIDQLEEINEPIFLAFQGRLRRYKSGRKFFATCNPAGHDWMWSKFVDAPPSEEYVCFTAITLENIYLPEDYIKELLAYPDKWVKRYVYCSWEDFQGLVYSEYVETKHKIPFYTPSMNEEFVMALDYGFRNPTAILWASTDYDGITRIFDEYYAPGKLIPEIAETIKKKPYSDKAYKIADPSINKTERDGQNVQAEFMQNGVYLANADNDVRQGIDRVNQMFKAGKLLICENCVNTLSEIGNYKWRELKAGEVKNEYEEPVKSNDHAMDALRYLVNYIYKPVKKEIIQTATDYQRKKVNENDYSLEGI